MGHRHARDLLLDGAVRVDAAAELEGEALAKEQCSELYQVKASLIVPQQCPIIVFWSATLPLINL